jgi:hypothetical protein
MNARYLAIWKLIGANTLVAGGNLELVRLNEPRLVATVTADPEPFFPHIDQSVAIANRIWKGLIGVFASDQSGTFQQWFAAEVESVKAGRAHKGVFLVFEGETDVPAPNFTKRRDTDVLAVCFDAIDKSELKEVFRQSIQATMAGLSISLPTNADRQIESVGETIYLVEPDTEKPIYTFSVQMGAPKLSLATPLSDAVVSEAAKRISKVISDKTLVRPASLLFTSLNRTTDPLQAFIAAWSALEIFVNATFKATYESQWFDIMENGAPDAAKPVFERFKDVMKDRYRLADKFLIIASVLDASIATADADEFRRLRIIRDALLHGLETPVHLPTEATQSLLSKYMLLHIDKT